MYSEKQQKIFDAVMLLAQQGVSLYAVKVQEIATAAGVGKGTLYEYFTSKEEILLHTMIWCLEKEINLLGSALTEGASFEQDMTALQLCFSQILRQRGSVYRLIMSGLAEKQPEQYHHLFDEQMERGRQLREYLLQKGRVEGKINPAHSNEYCDFVITTTLCSLVCPGDPGLDRPTTTEFALQMLRKALA